MSCARIHWTIIIVQGVVPKDAFWTLRRADAAELLDINRGAWPLDKVKSEAERLFQLAQEAYVRSPLPPEPDRPRAERLCVEMISEYHKLSV